MRNPGLRGSSTRSRSGNDRGLAILAKAVIELAIASFTLFVFINFGPGSPVTWLITLTCIGVFVTLKEE
jgi:hypothetical protein